METIACSSFPSRPRKPNTLAERIAEVEPRIRALAIAIARTEQVDADDLLQIGLEIALRRLQTFKPGAGLSFYSYIYPATREAMYAACSRERTGHEAREDELRENDLAGATTPEDLVLEAHEDADRRRRVRGALDTLDPIDLELIQLHVIERVCLAEAARRVGLPYDRARYRYQCALGVLRRRLRVR